MFTSTTLPGSPDGAAEAEDVRWAVWALLAPVTRVREWIAQEERVHLAIIHGENDDVVTLDQGRTLFAKAREPKEMWVVAGRGHADLGETPGYDERVVAFFATHLRGE